MLEVINNIEREGGRGRQDRNFIAAVSSGFICGPQKTQGEHFLPPPHYFYELEAENMFLFLSVLYLNCSLLKLRYNSCTVKVTLLKYAIPKVSEYSLLCNHHCLIPEYFHHPKRNCVSTSSNSLFPPPSSPWQSLTYLLSLWSCLLRAFYINRITYCVVFCD